jgi:hypothetical protein
MRSTAGANPVKLFTAVIYEFSYIVVCYTRLERFTKDKHSSLVQKFVNYGRKKFYNIGLGGETCKTFYGRNLRIFVIN